MEKKVETVDVVGEERRVICLANTGNNKGTKRDTKTGLLGSEELFKTKNFVKVRTADPAMLLAVFVMDWAHYLAIPIKVCLAVF